MATSEMTCPTPDRLVEYAAGSGAPEWVRAVAGHVDGCEACRRAVVALLGSTLSGAEPRGAPALPQPGELVGRYRVRAQVGAGGMGVVFAAHDPELDRDVALKLLRVDVLCALDEAEGGAEERLRREARAMAKLSHPHLVTAFDIGTHEGRLFLAMELVPRTLRGWLAERPRGWAEVVGVLAGAGRGLAAAHAVGVIHRDLKPDNILVGDDDIARVTDFGLARIGGAVRTPSSTILDAAAPPHTHEIVGTPLYMAPEQLRGERADARSDRFSFCVTLYEALWGTRPFDAGDPPSLDGLLANVDGGRVKPPPTRGTPAWLRAAILRGLARDPDARFPSMEALVAALEPPRRRGRIVALAIAGLATVVGGAVLVGQRSRPPLCQPSDPRALAATEARRAVENAGRSTPEAHAAAIEVLAALDRYAAAWAEARTDACRATRVRGEQSEAMLDARIRCLDDRALEARVALALLHDPKTLVAHGRERIARLPPIASCAASPSLGGLAPPPTDPDRRARHDLVNQQLAAARARYEAGDYPTAAAEAEAEVTAARAIGHAPTTARALLLEGLALANRQRWDEAAQALEEATRVGDEARDDRTRASALTRLIFVREAKGDAAALDRTARDAAAVLSRLDGDADLASGLEVALGAVDFTRGRFAEALAHEKRAVAFAERAFGPDDLRLAAALGNLAAVESELGHLDDARRLFERALGISRRVRGAAHPETAVLERNYGDFLRIAGDPAAALPLVTHALPILARAYGERSDRVLNAYAILSTAYLTMDRSREALDAADKALAISLAVFGPTHDETVNARLDRAFALVSLPSERAEARREADRLAALAEGGPKESAGDGKLLGDVALLYILVGEPAKARRAVAEARRIATRNSDEEELAVLDRLEGDLALARTPAVAERFYRRARSRFEAHASTRDHRQTAALRGLGAALRAQRRPAEALLPLAWAATIPHPPSEQREAIVAYGGALLEALSQTRPPRR